VLARPLADSLDWDTYSLTMAEPTWSAMWGEIQSDQAYGDGVELGLRLLQATQLHQERLTPRAYAASQMRLYRSILTMLDKAGRWDAYLRAWDIILTHTDLCVNLKGDAVEKNPALAAFVRRLDGGLGVAQPAYGVSRRVRVDVHFLHTLLGRKAVAARRLTQRSPSAPADPSEPLVLATEDIQRRLVQAGAPVSPAADRPARPGAGAVGDGGIAEPGSSKASVIWSGQHYPREEEL